MKGFIVYSTYKTVKNKPHVLLFGRLENNETFVTINEYTPYFYIKSSDVKKARKISKDFEVKEVKLKDPQDEKVTRVETETPQEIPKLRKLLEDHNIPCYEADIKYPQRFLIDKKIQGSLDIDGDHDSEGEIDRVYINPSLKPVEWFPKLKVLSLDIETNSRAEEIYCISLYTDDFKKVLINSPKKLKNVVNYSSEEDLLEGFVEHIHKIDPDIITGWHLIDFDLKIIMGKLKEYGLPLNLGRDNSAARLRVESSFFRDSKADFVGRQVLDGIHLLKVLKTNPNLRLPDYKLDTAAAHFLKEHKLLEGEGDKGLLLEKLFREDQQKLVDYNLKDSELVYKILEKSKILDLAIKRSLITGMSLDKVSASIGSLDSIYFKYTKEAGYVLPSTRISERQDQGVGGFVMESKPGIYDNIIVFDFKSLYPSLIMTYNIDPLSMVETGGLNSPADVRFKQEVGILPKIIAKLWKERDLFRKNKDEIGREAVKLLMNSFYGTLASPLSRYFNRTLGNSITLNAQFMIKNTAKLMEDRGYEVIYGDTDSIFVVSKTKSLAEAQKLGNKLSKELNEHYTKWIKEEYGRDSHVELEFEKTYTKFLMPKLRGGSTGAKKRYAGLLEGKKVDITGMEAVRGDWTDLAKKFQRVVLDLVFHDKDVLKYMKKLIEDVHKGKYDDMLVYRKSIRKELSEYTKINPPHVKAARKLKKLESSRIEYVITIDGPEPIQQIKHPLDYKHYIDRQIKPVASSILEALGKTFEEVEKGHSQASLMDF